MDTDSLVQSVLAESASMDASCSSSTTQLTRFSTTTTDNLSSSTSASSLTMNAKRQRSRSDSLTSLSSLSSDDSSLSSSSEGDDLISSTRTTTRRPLVFGERVRLVPVDDSQDAQKWYLERGFYTNPFPIELSRPSTLTNPLTNEQIDAHEWISEDVYDALPLPMFWGEESLLDGEREFRLSYDIMRDFWDTSLDTDDELEMKTSGSRRKGAGRKKRRGDGGRGTKVRVPKSVKKERKAEKREKRVKALEDVVEEDSPCPPVFKRIPRNIFVERRPEKALLPAICSCKLAEGATTGCGEGCINRLMQYSCNPNDCPLGEACSNKPFNSQQGIPEGQEGVRIFYTGNRGWGLRSAVPIKKGQFIMEYRGEIISRDESYKRVVTMYQNNTSFYFLDYDGSDVIDAGRKGNSARFINHSCDPNCHVVRWKLAGFEEYQIGIFALRDIEPLQELTYDYGWQDYSTLALKAGVAAKGEEEEQDGRQRCFCGASTCTGWLGVRREKGVRKSKKA